jgi:hypothetical protein
MEEHSNIWVAIQPSETRCYTDDEYRYQGIAVRENLSDCDSLLGVERYRHTCSSRAKPT